MPGCVRQSYGKTPLVLNVRDTTVSVDTGMLGGAPSAAWNVTSCCVPEMLNLTSVPAFTVMNGGLNARPGVYTSTTAPPGDVGASFPPEQAVPAEAMPMTISEMSVRIRVSRWMTLSLAAALITSACSKGDSVTGPGGPTGPATPVGAYTLSTVDAKALPWTMYSDVGYTLEVQGSTLAITADGKWVSKTVTRETVAGNVSTYSDSTFGTWTVTTSGTSAVLTNAETSDASNVTWTATTATVLQLDGATTHAYLFTKN